MPTAATETQPTAATNTEVTTESATQPTAAELRVQELEQELAASNNKLEKSVKAEKSLRERIRTFTERETEPEKKPEAVDAGAEAMKRVEALEAELQQERLRNQLIGKVADVDLAMMIVGDFVEDGSVQLEALLEQKPILRPKQEVGAMLPTGSGNSSAPNSPEDEWKRQIEKRQAS